MIKKVLAAAAIAAASLLVAIPANALSVGDTVCYAADGSAVVNPSNPDDFEYCMTREGSGGGGNLPQLCTVVVHSYGYNDSLGSTGPYTILSCTPIAPLRG